MMKIYARFRFHESPTPFFVNKGETKNVTINTINGPATVEIGLKEINEDSPSIKEHLTPYFRNYGGGMFTNFGGDQTDQVVHPKDVVVVFEDVGKAKIPGFHRFNRHNKTVGAVEAGDYIVGLKDAWVKEPTAIFAGNFAGSDTDDVAVFCLEDVAPYTPFPAKYQTEIDPRSPKEGEDPMSLYAHRLRGGMANMWNVLLIDKDKPNLVSFSRSPIFNPKSPIDKWHRIRQLAGVVDESARAKRVTRFQKIIDSMNRGKVISDPVHGKAYPFIWYFFRGTDRFLNWAATDDILDISDKAQNIGWKTYGDLFWAEGPYNLGYDWLLIAARMWLDNPTNQFWWQTFIMFAEWQCMQGTCWQGRWKGMQWYEKGKRGWEVGSDYWPSGYKQRSQGLLVAKEIYEAAYGEIPWWLTEALDSHRTAMRGVTGAAWDGDYGERIAGWAMINAASFYRHEKDPEFKENGIKQALNYINLCKLRIHTATHLDDKWKDGRLGIPFCPNGRSTPPWVTASWEMAKAARGMIEILAWCAPNPEDAKLIHDKVMQMAKFLAEECINLDSDITLPIDAISSDLVPAKYLGGYYQINTPRDIEGQLPWLLVPIGYAAVNGSPSCKKIYSQCVHDSTTYIETGIGELIQEEYWEGWQNKLTRDDEAGTCTLEHKWVSTEKVRPGIHMIRLRNQNGRETMHAVIGSESQKLVIDNEEGILSNDNPNMTYDWVITGPIISAVRSMADKAIRKWSVKAYDKAKLKNAEFNWNHGQHFNTWFKNIGNILNQWDYPYMIQKMLDDQQEREG